VTLDDFRRMNSNIARRFEVFTGIAISLIVLLLVGFRLTNAGALWRDECAIVQLARMPDVGSIFANFSHEAFPPPFSLLIRGWTNCFGYSDAALRCYGFAVAVLLTGGLWVVFRNLGAGVPLLSLAWVGLSATFLVWGTSVRGYGIGTFFIVLVFGLIRQLMLKPTKWTAIACTLAGLVSMQFLVQNAVLLAAIAVAAAAVSLSRREWRIALVAAAAITISLLSFLPYVNSYLHAAGWSVVVQPSDSRSSAAQQLTQFFGGPLAAAMCVIVLVGVVALAVVQLLRLRDKSEFPLDFIVYCCLGAFLSVIGSEVFFRLLNYARQPWYSLAPLSLALVAADAVAAVSFQSNLLRLTRLGLAIAMVTLLAWTNWPRLMERQTNIDVVAKLVGDRAGNDDLIVVNPWQLGIPFSWYYQGPARWITLPQLEEHRVHRYDLIKEKMMSPTAVDDVMDLVSATLRSGGRLWLVGGARFSPKPTPPLPPAPNSPFGWDNVAYTRSWSQQLGSFIQLHGGKGENVQLPQDLPVNPLEHVPLAEVEGWKP